MLTQRHNTDPGLITPQLALIESTVKPDPFEEMNREFLEALGGLSIEEWYRQNGLGRTEPTPTDEVIAGLAARWVYLAGIVEFNDDVSDLANG